MTTLSHTSRKGYIIAIDGPVASGKGTIAPQLADLLQGFYLYSGSVFRCIGLYCLEHAIDTRDEKTIEDILPHLRITVTDKTYLLNNKDVTQRIREEDVAMASSNVAMFRAVRERMVSILRSIASEKVKEGKTVVTEGRDTANSVFPHADCKIFLTARPEVRANRRLSQIVTLGHVSTVSFESVLADTVTRDAQDMNRVLNPLSKEPEKMGYVIIDNSELTEEQTIHAIIRELKKKKLLYD